MYSEKNILFLYFDQGGFIYLLFFQSMDIVAMTTVGAEMKSVEMQQTCQKYVI